MNQIKANVKYKQVSSPQKFRKKKKATYLAFANFLANKAFCPRPAAAPFVVIPGTILADINRSVSYTVFFWHDPKLSRLRASILDPTSALLAQHTLCPYSPLRILTTHMTYSPDRHSNPSFRPSITPVLEYKPIPSYLRFDTPNGFAGMILA